MKNIHKTFKNYGGWFEKVWGPISGVVMVQWFQFGSGEGRNLSLDPITMTLLLEK